MNQDGFVLQVEEKQHTKAARVIRGLLGSSELGNYIQSNGRPAVVSISIYLLLHLIFHTDLLPWTMRSILESGVLLSRWCLVVRHNKIGIELLLYLHFGGGRTSVEWMCQMYFMILDELVEHHVVATGKQIENLMREQTDRIRPGPHAPQCFCKHSFSLLH